MPRRGAEPPRKAEVSNKVWSCEVCGTVYREESINSNGGVCLECGNPMFEEEK